MKRILALIFICLCLPCVCIADDFFGPRLIDSNALSNGDDSGLTYVATSQLGEGHSFTGKGTPLSTATFALKRTSTALTGTLTAKVYLETHATAYGTDSLPTEAALATSVTYDMADLTTSFQTVIFRFANAYTPAAGTYYVIALEASALSGTDKVYIRSDTDKLHAGNDSYYTTAWGVDTDGDIVFNLY